MSKFNTDKVREELESDVWGARELQSQLRKTLDEIDRLEKIEQHTKETVWKVMQLFIDPDGCDYIKNLLFSAEVE